MTNRTDRTRMITCAPAHPIAVAALALAVGGCNDSRQGDDVRGDGVPDGGALDAAGLDGAALDGSTGGGDGSPIGDGPRENPNYPDTGHDVSDFHPALDDVPQGMEDGDPVWCRSQLRGYDVSTWLDATGIYIGAMNSDHSANEDDRGDFRGSGVYRFDGVGWDWLSAADDSDIGRYGEGLVVMADEFWLGGRFLTRPADFYAEWELRGRITPSDRGFLRLLNLPPHLLYREDGPWRPVVGTPLPSADPQWQMSWARGNITAVSDEERVLVRWDEGDWTTLDRDAGQVGRIGSIGDDLFVHYAYPRGSRDHTGFPNQWWVSPDGSREEILLDPQTCVFQEDPIRRYPLVKVLLPPNPDTLLLVRHTDIVELTRDGSRVVVELPRAEGEACGEGLRIHDAAVGPTGHILIAAVDESDTRRECGVNYVLYWDGETLRWI